MSYFDESFYKALSIDELIKYREIYQTQLNSMIRPLTLSKKLIYNNLHQQIYKINGILNEKGFSESSSNLSVNF